jgi:hypothetical protein
VSVDRIYLAACARDARLTRICLASIRYFHPDAPIQILAGDILQSGLAEELKRRWNVEVADLPAGDYGWGLVKLEPLFGPPGQRFLVMDVDTVFTGRVLDLWDDGGAPFLVDDEQLSDADFKRLYYDWDRLAAIDPDAQSARSAFNVGQWFGTAGLVPREAFDRWVEWTLPRRLTHPDVFMGGDQGVLNYVLLKKEALEGLRIDRRTLMRWPGHAMDGLDVASVAGGTAPALVVHWAGLKADLLRDMPGGELLQFFEDWYWARMPMGRIRRRLALARHLWIQWSFAIGRRARLRWARWTKARPSAAPARLVRKAIAS